MQKSCEKNLLINPEEIIALPFASANQRGEFKKILLYVSICDSLLWLVNNIRVSGIHSQS